MKQSKGAQAKNQAQHSTRQQIESNSNVLQSQNNSNQPVMTSTQGSEKALDAAQKMMMLAPQQPQQPNLITMAKSGSTNTHQHQQKTSSLAASAAGQSRQHQNSIAAASPSPLVASASVFDQQKQLHRMVQMKKQTAKNKMDSQHQYANSPELISEGIQSEVSSALLPKQPQAAGRLTHQQARTMRISQQRIMREGGSSLETVPQAVQPIELTSQQLNNSSQGIRTVSSAAVVHQRNFASEGLTFNTLNESIQNNGGQKLVKKVAMKQLQQQSTIMASSGSSQQPSSAGVNHNQVLSTVRQSSMTQRQGPILPGGPHTRSKSSAICGGDVTSIQMQQRPATNRKSNSRGRATPQNRLTQLNGSSVNNNVGLGLNQQMMILHQQQQVVGTKKQKKQSLEQIQKSSITITSPKQDTASGGAGDLNTSLPLPLSKSHNRMMQHLDKSQISMGTGGRQQQAFKPTPQQQQAASSIFNQHQVISSAVNKSAAAGGGTGTPSGPTYQHTRKQSTTRHRSNSKKRGSINTSIQRRISRSPGGQQKVNNSFAAGSNGGAAAVNTTQQSINPATLNSKASIKSQQHHQQLIHHHNQHNNTAVASGGTGQKNQQAKMLALAASAFNQQHATSVLVSNSSSTDAAAASSANLAAAHHPQYSLKWHEQYNNNNNQQALLSQHQLSQSNAPLPPGTPAPQQLQNSSSIDSSSTIAQAAAGTNQNQPPLLKGHRLTPLPSGSQQQANPSATTLKSQRHQQQLRQHQQQRSVERQRAVVQPTTSSKAPLNRSMLYEATSVQDTATNNDSSSSLLHLKSSDSKLLQTGVAGPIWVPPSGNAPNATSAAKVDAGVDEPAQQLIGVELYKAAEQLDTSSLGFVQPLTAIDHKDDDAEEDEVDDINEKQKLLKIMQAMAEDEQHQLLHQWQDSKDNKQGPLAYQKLQQIRGATTTITNNSKQQQYQQSNMKPASVYEKQKDMIQVYQKGGQGADHASANRQAMGTHKPHASSTSATTFQQHLYNGNEAARQGQSGGNLPNSQFSSFSKDHLHQNNVVQVNMLEAKHQTAQKSQRPAKNSLTSTEMAASSQSPTTRQQKRQNTSVYAAPPQQQQFMHILKQQSNQQQQRNANHGQVNHQQSTTSSAQSSRTAHDIYIKQQPHAKKNNLIGGPIIGANNSSQTKAMSSRTMNSNGASTPYDVNSRATQQQASTSSSVVQNLYGSQQQVAALRPVAERTSGGATFHDFRPKTSIGTANEGESRSLMMLERDVEGLSPEPRAEIILTKNQIQRAARANKLQGQSQIISIPKQESRSMQFQKLKFSQIQHANQSLQKLAAKKVIKSQRVMQQSQNHAKSSLANAAANNNQQQQIENMYSDPAAGAAGGGVTQTNSNNTLGTLNANYINQQMIPHQTLENKHGSAHSMLVQNWIHSSDSLQQQNHQQVSDLASHYLMNPADTREAKSTTVISQQQQQQQEIMATKSNKGANSNNTSQTYRQIGIGQTTRQRFQNGNNGNQIQQQQTENNSASNNRSLFSSEKQQQAQQTSVASASLPQQISQNLANQHQLFGSSKSSANNVLPSGIVSKKQQSLLMMPSSKSQRTATTSSSAAAQLLQSVQQATSGQQHQNHSQNHQQMVQHQQYNTPFNAPSMHTEDQTHSQKVLMQTNHHQLSHQHVPQSHLKSVQVHGTQNSSVSAAAAAGAINHKVLKSQASAGGGTRSTRESILQAEQSHQKILGPPSLQPSVVSSVDQPQVSKTKSTNSKKGSTATNITTQKNKQVLRTSTNTSKAPDVTPSGQLSANHNAYANNAEDYFKKAKAMASGPSSSLTTAGTKTPGDQESVKLLRDRHSKKKMGQQSQKQSNNKASSNALVSQNSMRGQALTSSQMGDKANHMVVAESNDLHMQSSSLGPMGMMGSLSLKKKVSAKASPQLPREQLLGGCSEEETDANRLLETQSALTVTAAPTNSFVSQSSMIAGQNLQQVNAVSASNSVINDSKSFGMSRSRLSAFVLQSNASGQQNAISGKTSQNPQSSVSAGSSSTKVPVSQHQPTAGSKKTVLSSNQVQMVQHNASAGSGYAAKSQPVTGGKHQLTQSELMRKKNQAKMVGNSALSMKQQQNLHMQHLLTKKDRQNNQGQQAAQPASGARQQQSPTKQRLPNTIHPNMKSNQVYASRQADTGQMMLAQSQQHQAHNQQAQPQEYQEYLQQQQTMMGSESRSAAKSHKSNKNLPAKNMMLIDGGAGAQTVSEARSQTALAHQQQSQSQMENNSSANSSSLFNMNHPARPVTDFEAPNLSGSRSQLQYQGEVDGNIHLHQYNANFQYSSSRYYEINEQMPQRMNLANMVEKIDKKLQKGSMLQTSQLSSTTTTSQSSSSYINAPQTQKSSEDHHGSSKSKSNQKTGSKKAFAATNSAQNSGNPSATGSSSLQQPKKQEVLSHLVTFDAHSNSVIGLQAINRASGQVASFAKDNTVKVWSISNQKPTQFIANNRAAAVNLPPKVVLKRQIKNQARASQKLSSFTFMTTTNYNPAQTSASAYDQQFQSSILITGCTDKVLRLYAMDSPQEPDVFEKVTATARKDPNYITETDVIKPSIRLTGQHLGVISSIVQLPEPTNDLFLTGCSDGLIRMFSLSALGTEAKDEALCSFDQGKSGVQQVCPISETAFLSSGHDNTVRLWDIRAKQHQRILNEAHFGKVTWLQKYDNSTFASACNDGLVNFWDTRKMKLEKQYIMPAHGSICSIQFARKRQCMLVAHDHRLSVINMDSGSTDNSHNSQRPVIKTSISQHKSFSVMAEGQEPPIGKQTRNSHALATESSWGRGAKITSMVYSEVDKKVYMGGYNKKITVWNLNLDAFNN